MKFSQEPGPPAAGEEPKIAEGQHPFGLALEEARILSEGDGRLHVSYELKVRRPEVSSSWTNGAGAVRRDIQYRSERLIGSCRTTPGRPAVIAKSGGRSIVLQLEETARPPEKGPERLQGDYLLRLLRDDGSGAPPRTVTESLISSGNASIGYEAAAVAIAGQSAPINGRFQATLAESPLGLVLDYYHVTSRPTPMGRGAIEFLTESSKGRLEVRPGVAYPLYRSDRDSYLLTVERHGSGKLSESPAPTAGKEASTPPLGPPLVVTFGLRWDEGGKAEAKGLTDSVLELSAALENTHEAARNAPALLGKCKTSVLAQDGQRLLVAYEVNARIQVDLGGRSHPADEFFHGVATLEEGEEKVLVRSGDRSFFLMVRRWNDPGSPKDQPGRELSSPDRLDTDGLERLAREYRVALVCEAGGKISNQLEVVTSAPKIAMGSGSKLAMSGSLKEVPGGPPILEYVMEIMVPGQDEDGRPVLRRKDAQGSATLVPGKPIEVLREGNQSFSILLRESASE